MKVLCENGIFGISSKLAALGPVGHTRFSVPFRESRDRIMIGP